MGVVGLFWLLNEWKIGINLALEVYLNDVNNLKRIKKQNYEKNDLFINDFDDCFECLRAGKAS